MPSKSDLPSHLKRRWQKIEQQMEENRCHLERQGSLAARQSGGRRVWMLRFFMETEGRHVQRSIYVGGDDQPELLKRVRGLLAYYREVGRHKRGARDCARLVGAMVAMMRSPGRHKSGLKRALRCSKKRASS